MTNEYFAIYKEGNSNPIGAIRSEYADQVIEDLTHGTSDIFYKKPITDKQAEEIRDRITQISDLERLLPGR